jgi:hypothetical protein
MVNLQFFTWLEMQSLCLSAPIRGQHGVLEKKTPIDTAEYTLTLHTHAEEKRVRVRHMWARAGWDRMNST